MRRVTVSLIVVPVIAVLAFVLAACSDVSTGTPTQPSPTTGQAVFVVSDAAADMGSVTGIKVTIDSLRVHAQGGAWTTVSTSARTFDLLDLNAKGTAKLLAQANLDTGAYDQIEMNVSKVIVVDSKGEHQAKLPSNKLHINGALDVRANATATANFDFIAHQSLHLTGEGTYVLAPVIKLQTMADAKAQVKSNNEVEISGGNTTSDVQVGMNVEGTVDTGLRIAPDAVLSIAASGRVVQIKGQALATGTIKAVDTATGTVTITTQRGTDLVLHASGDSTIKVGSSAATMATLAANIGSEAAARYDAETKTIAAIAAQANANAKAEIGANLGLSGTVTSVDAASGTATITTDSGASVAIKVGPEAKVDLGGTAIGLLGLGSLVGAKVEGQFNADTGQATELHAAAEAKASAAGVLKAVDVAAGTVTITAQPEADVVLRVTSDTKVLVNGSLSTLASLAANIGAQVTAEYNVQTKMAISVTAQGQAQAQATASISGTLKAVDVVAGTVTIATQTGADVVLKVAADTKLLLKGPVSTLASPAAIIGSQVQAEYSVQTKIATSIKVHSQTPAPAPSPTQAPAPAPTVTPAPTQVQATASVSGTLKAVNVVSGTVTIATQTGADLVLNVSSSTQVLINGSVSALITLVANVGAQVTATYNIQTMMASSIQITPSPPAPVPAPTATPSPTQAQTTVSGTLQAVSLLNNTVTILTSSGTQLVLQVTSQTKVTVNGASSSFVALATRTGTGVTAEFDAQTKTAIELVVGA